MTSAQNIPQIGEHDAETSRNRSPITDTIDVDWPEMPSPEEVVELLTGRSRRSPSIQGEFGFLTGVSERREGKRRKPVQ